MSLLMQKQAAKESSQHAAHMAFLPVTSLFILCLVYFRLMLNYYLYLLLEGYR